MALQKAKQHPDSDILTEAEAVSGYSPKERVKA